MTEKQVPAHIADVWAERAGDPVYQTWRLCLACGAAPDDRHHQPGYRMERSPYDIPGHEYIAPPEMDDPDEGAEESGDPIFEAASDHDPSGRACALAGRVMRGDIPMTADACEACISDSVPPMVSEVAFVGDQRIAVLDIGGARYTVQRNVSGPATHGVWFLLTGPRGAVSALMPYIEQPSPGVLHLIAMTTGRSAPHYAAGKTFLFVAGRLGYIR